MAFISFIFPAAALLSLLLAGQALTFGDIAKQVDDPEYYLKQFGPLVVMGNCALDSANIVFLPEIHDDPESLTVQLLLLAKEKQRGKPFIVLDESLKAMKKSMWDIFSEKTLEIIAASEQRKNHQTYAPGRFEMALKRLANKYKSTPGEFNLRKDAGLWTLQPYLNWATPFYGWDYGSKNSSLLKRNEKMVESLNIALKDNDRILVMAGARHIPELEFLTSQKLLCNKDRFASMGPFFSRIERIFGDQPMLNHGIGASLPVYNFLSTKRYALVFTKGLYKELDQVVEQFKSKGNRSCYTIP